VRPRAVAVRTVSGGARAAAGRYRRRRTSIFPLLRRVTIDVRRARTRFLTAAVTEAPRDADRPPVNRLALPPRPGFTAMLPGSSRDRV
jgi:hypothetical protein